MNAQRIDHTAIAVRDLDEAVPRYRRILGADPAERAVVADQGVEVCFIPLGDTQLELIQPLDPSSGVARFLERRGESLHHIGIAVHDLRRELSRLQAAGVELIDVEPRRGLHGLIAFVHPRSAGVLVELLQHDEPRLGDGADMSLPSY